MTGSLSRRDVMQLLGGTAIALQLPAAQPKSAHFFTKDEFALLEHLTDLLIPADDHSPGAKAAEVAAFIDRTTAEAIDPDEKHNWRSGLQLVDSTSKQMNGKTFLKAQPDQQIAVLKKMATNETKPETIEERFFGQLKQTTAFVYYSSKIGIHQEMEYKGNVLLQQFAGFDVSQSAS